ncbi:MAG: pyridoxamine 5'-phosphate oxidase family protein [Clostridia bacterium]|nr:pyridoxamine 5'-phosphate oxidase family protein [Clostridia bacterium]
MFRKMRKDTQQLPREEALRILKEGSSGVLALRGDEDYPYAVPMSYAFEDGKIYFHCAPEGHKIDAVRKHDKASFCVIARDEIIPLNFTTYYESAVAFGRIRFVEDKAEWLRAIRLIADKYAPHHPTGPEKEISSSMGYMLILRMDIEHLTGKQARELAKGK